MGRGAGRNGGGASPPLTQGPGTHLFHLLGREGHRVRGGPKWNPTHLPHPPKGPQSSGTRTGRGQSLPPNCKEDRAPGAWSTEDWGIEGRGIGRQEQGGWAGGLKEKEEGREKCGGGEEEQRGEGRGGGRKREKRERGRGEQEGKEKGRKKEEMGSEERQSGRKREKTESRSSRAEWRCLAWGEAGANGSTTQLYPPCTE